MTQDEIIRMAREAGLPVDDSLGFPLAHLNESTIFAFNLWIERFYNLVAAHEREKWEQALPIAMDAMMLQEREACAKVCENIATETYSMTKLREYGECAEAIRARGKK